MAQRLADGVRDIDGVQITQPVEANVVFAIIDPAVTERLQRDWPFYVWDENTGEVRWMAAWDTTPEDVDAFVADVRAARQMTTAVPVTSISGRSVMSTVSRLRRPMSSPWTIVTVAGSVTRASSRR